MQALKEAFEVFCNKGVAGSTSAELLATFCDNLLKKGGSEKLSDEAIEDTLEKASDYFDLQSLEVETLCMTLVGYSQIEYFALWYQTSICRVCDVGWILARGFWPPSRKGLEG
jgi:hypothetical protein